MIIQLPVAVVLSNYVHDGAWWDDALAACPGLSQQGPKTSEKGCIEIWTVQEDTNSAACDRYSELWYSEYAQYINYDEIS